MRLVDADMITLYLIVEGQNHPDKYGFSWGDTIKFSPSEVKKIIQKMPTIEERKRINGHWVEIGDEPYDEWECDVCGFVIDGSGCIDPEEYKDVYKFCPNCGADMRGVEE